MRKSLTSALLVALLLVLTHLLPASAQVTIVEPGWTLVRTITFAGAHAAHYNPVDEKIYVGRNGPVPTENGVFRINADGSATQVGSIGTIGGVAIDPRDGDVFFSFPITVAAIYRTPFGGTGGTAAERWVSVISPTGADTDPEGLAIAPPTYQGTVVQPGDAIVVDVGHDNPEHVWRFSADTRQAPVRLHVDNGTLVEPWDVTIGKTDIYIADSGPPGRIYRLDPGGSLVRFSPPILAPAGIVEDPVKGDLLVLDIASPPRVVRFNPATGAVTDLLIGLAGPRHAGIDISPDGEVLVVTDRTANRIYVFQRNVGPLRIVTSELRTDVVGIISSQTLEAEFGAPPYVWTLVAGALPAGMTLESNGILHGTPTQAGTFPLTVRVRDSAGTTVDATFEKVVQATAPPPEIRVSKFGTRAVPGRILSYFILVENRGNAEATNLDMTEYVDPWFYLAGAQPWPHQFTIVERPVAGTPKTLPLVEQMTWVLPALAPGSFQILRYDVALDAGMPLGVSVQGRACLGRPNPDERGACYDDYRHRTSKGRQLCIEAMDAIDYLDDAAGPLAVVKYGEAFASAVVSATAIPLLRVTAEEIADEANERFGGDQVDGAHACLNAIGKFAQFELNRCLRLANIEPFKPLCPEHEQDTSGPADPNEKVVLPPGFIQPDQRLHYVVRFENVSDEVEARDVFVTDTLDTRVDLTSLHVMSPTGDTLPLGPGETVTLFERTKTRSVDVGGTIQEIEVLEQWTASLTPTTRTLAWALRNIDLAPHATDTVAYHVVPSPGLPSGTQIRNAAVIQFEVFTPITTNEVVNTIDTTAPRCDLEGLPPTYTSPNVTLTWTGTDTVGEIADYRLLVSDNGGPFTAFAHVTDTTTVFPGERGHEYAFLCLATDTAGNAESQALVAEVRTTILPNQPPVALCQDVVVSGTSTCEAGASIDAGSFDPDGQVAGVVQSPLGPYALGETAVVLAVMDNEGATDSCTARVTVEDKIGPVIASVSTNPSVLWPPNHKMVPVAVSVAVSDLCPVALRCQITSVNSSEPVDGLGDGDTAPDWEITGDLAVNLRAERSGTGSGREYTIKVECSDNAGNSTSGEVKVIVPHDKENGKKASLN